MRNRVGAWVTGVVVALIAVGLWTALREKHPTTAVEASSDVAALTSRSETSAVTKPAPRNSSAASAVSAIGASISQPSASHSPPPFAPPDEAAMIEADKVGLMIRDYRTLAKENPVGTNAEIMAAVMGGNAKQATLGPPEGMSLNESGELIDRWGTPYFFHQLARDEMEIRSAGADKVMWTDDDAVTR